MKRNEGFYWVKYENKWIVAFYNEVEVKFELTMSDCYFDIDEFDEVDEFPIVRE
jgi:hypothetical protein